MWKMNIFGYIYLFSKIPIITDLLAPNRFLLFPENYNEMFGYYLCY